MKKKTLKIWSYPYYDIRLEIIDGSEFGGKDFEMRSAYNKRGDYIGNQKDAYRLVKKYGITHFEKTDEAHCVVSIGYSSSRKKWYGWGHRAIFGFKPGSKCKKGDCHYVPRRHYGKGAWTAKTWEDAKQMAKDFAEGVS